MNQTEHSVFISYSSKNEAIADMIRKGLEEAGIPCWFAPRDIRSVSWADAIMNALKKVDVFVLVMTKDSLESREVEKEVARGEGKLANEKFVAKAPAALIEEERSKLANYKDMLEKTSQRLEAVLRKLG